ncbi:hypothetical protein [Saccharibacillus sacchari]|uniref:Uncharacterized protein n=1 Tax=Saccharibacillus sacchari TaxID=456493 RepID=A0ACC6PIM0_9BACL
MIGGAACDLIFDVENGTAFRATKDLDLVLIVEALNPEFGRVFWSFIREGGYEHTVKSTGLPQFYRFSHPTQHGFPFMLELFSRSGFELDDQDSTLTPLPIGEEVSSLSAILIDEDYYRMLLEGRESIEGIRVLSELYLIPFKAKAWLDLTLKKLEGSHVDSKDIKKHKNDIARLAMLLSGEEHCALPETVMQDMKQFMEAYRQEPSDPKSWGMNISAITIVDVLDRVYGTGTS